MPVLVAAVGLLFRRGLKRKHHVTPLVCAELGFALCFAGLGVSLYPLMVPPAITICQAALPLASRVFLGVGAVVIVPVILCYNAHAHWVFRGKVTPRMNYH